MTTGTGGQLPLALRHSPDQRLDPVGGARPGAFDQLRALATPPGADWLFVAGPPGVGKTHLALAVCAAAEAVGRHAAYLPLAAARGRLRAALDALHGHDVVAIAGDRAQPIQRDDEVALFDFHNRARSAGTAVLYAAEAGPDALPLVLPDLRSRLGQCARVVLAPLDDEGRRQVLRERARRRGLVLDEAALEWLLRRVGRDLASLTALLDRLDRASLAAQRRITVPFLRDTIGPP